MKKDHVVIAVSSISGGGKTVVVKKLVELLGDAVALHFDDYETADTYPEDLASFLERGADFNRVKSPLLAQHLQALRRGKAIVAPRTGDVVPPARYIVFEGPLGRAQHETGQYIDFLVFIDTPLEVGLARRLLRTFATSDIEQMDRDQLLCKLRSIRRLGEDYLAWMRKAYLIQHEIVRPASDLILGWEGTPEELAKAIIAALAEAGLV